MHYKFNVIFMGEIQKKQKEPTYEEIRSFFFKTGINVLPLYHQEIKEEKKDDTKTRIMHIL